MTISRTLTIPLALLVSSLNGCASDPPREFSDPIEEVFGDDDTGSFRTAENLDLGPDHPLEGVTTHRGDVEAPELRPESRRHEYADFGEDGFSLRVRIDRDHAITFRYPSRSFDTLWHSDPNRVGDDVAMDTPVFDVTLEHKVTSFEEESYYKKNLDGMNMMRSKVIEMAWTPYQGLPVAFWDHYHDYEFKFDSFGLFATESQFWLTGDEVLDMLSSTEVCFAGYEDTIWDLDAETGVDRHALLWLLRHRVEGVLPRFSDASLYSEVPDFD